MGDMGTREGMLTTQGWHGQQTLFIYLFIYLFIIIIIFFKG